MNDQQLVARIKRSSKYWGQTPHNRWFDVRMVADRHYQLRGNSNNYRVSDVAFGVRLLDGTIIDLSNGKLTSPKMLVVEGKLSANDVRGLREAWESNHADFKSELQQGT